ncbi:MAG TPA: adenosylcobinamide-phosphate synthase CbiB [Dehalococcoidia bacterium]
MRPDATFLTALALDRLLGEPPPALHPVVWLGRAVAWASGHVPWGDPRREFRYGLAMAAGFPLAAAAAGWLAVRAARSWSRPGGFLLAAWLLKTAFAVRNLEEAAAPVADALERGDLPAARRAVAMLVSRPVETLDAAGVASAAVESVAESTADAFLGPWLAYALFGLPGALAYRAVNTLDSMVGYHGRYEHAGRASARLDDALNLVPSRLAAACLVAAAAASGEDAAGAWRALRRDGGRTESPNAGRPMAAAAGALGVALEKPGHYRLNGGGRAPGPADVRRALRLARRAALPAALLVLLLRGLRRG